MVTIGDNELNIAQRVGQQVRTAIQSAHGTQKLQTGHNTGNRTAGAQGAKGDVLTISAEALGLLEEQDREAQGASTSVQDAINELFQKQSYQDQIKESRESGDAFADEAKMMEIARRIAAGDKVPAKDERKLMEYNSKLYQAAKSAAMLNAHKKHKKYKSLFDDEDGQSMQEKLRELENGETGTTEGNPDTVESSDSTDTGDAAGSGGATGGNISMSE